MSIRAVIFDFDGIIADTEDLHYQSYLPVLENAGMLFSYEEYADHYMAFDALGCLRQRAIDTDTPFDADTLHEWAEHKNDVFEDLVRHADVQPLPGALDAVKTAASLGPAGICTGAVLRDIAPLLDRFELHSYLTTVVTADDVEISKPDPACYRLAAENVGIPSEECLAIEDTPGGLRAARGAGYTTFAVTTTHTEEELAPFADRVLSSLVRFSKQDLI